MSLAFDFDKQMEQAAESHRSRASSKDVDFEVQSPNEACIVEGGAHLLERAVDNLLDNAVRYTPADGKITLKWWTEPKRIVFSVRDMGPGINPKDLPHLFEPMDRGEASRNPETGGPASGWRSPAEF